MKQIARIGLVLLIAVAVALFGGRAAQAQGHEDPPWGYEGEHGPEHWGELSPDYALCGTGVEQSPIDIPQGAPLNAGILQSSYLPSAVNIFHNGETIQVQYDPGSTITLDGETYELLQFHFHTPSEHTRAGQHAPLEMHLVHRSAAGRLAVVGVWLTPGAENAAYAPVFSNLPDTPGDPSPVAGATVNAEELLPENRANYRYNGSLTTPPCSEGVLWVMMEDAVELSQAQIDAFRAVIHENSRPVQPLNARSFLVGETAPSPAPATSATLPQTAEGERSPANTLAVAIGAILLVATGACLRWRAR